MSVYSFAYSIDGPCLNFEACVCSCSKEGSCLAPLQAIPDTWSSACGVHHQCYGSASQDTYEGNSYFLRVCLYNIVRFPYLIKEVANNVGCLDIDVPLEEHYTGSQPEVIHRLMTSTRCLRLCITLHFPVCFDLRLTFVEVKF